MILILEFPISSHGFKNRTVLSKAIKNRTNRYSGNSRFQVKIIYNIINHITHANHPFTLKKYKGMVTYKALVF